MKKIIYIFLIMISKDSFSKSFSPKNSIVQKNYTKKSKEISLKPIVLTLYFLCTSNKNN